jgi:hypothetical protein
MSAGLPIKACAAAAVKVPATTACMATLRPTFLCMAMAAAAQRVSPAAHDSDDGGRHVGQLAFQLASRISSAQGIRGARGTGLAGCCCAGGRVPVRCRWARHPGQARAGQGGSAVKTARAP